MGGPTLADVVAAQVARITGFAAGAAMDVRIQAAAASDTKAEWLKSKITSFDALVK